MVSSENRKYVPIGFTDASVVVNNKALFIPNGDLYTFGVLTSSIHMAWMKTVCGRLKSDYSYGVQIVYNTFPWLRPTAKQRAAIEETAKFILNMRNTLSFASESPTTLADLYDPLIMPKALLDAHLANDAAVLSAYYIRNCSTESEIVETLMKLYQSTTQSPPITATPYSRNT